MSDTVCTELAIEFFSTIHLLTPLTDYEREDALTFRLGGVERRLSIHQFAVYMGLYTEEEIDTPAFTTDLVDWPPEVKHYEFWTEIGIGAYDRPIPKSTKLRDPLHRLLHRAVVFSLASSSSSSGTVTISDLFYLYCIITGRPCQIAVCLARYLFSMRRSSVQAIYGGGYVHRLARAMGILPPADFAALTLSPLAVRIDLGMMIRMQMVRKEGTRHILLDGRQRPWVQPIEGGADPPMDEAAAPEQPAPQPEIQPETAGEDEAAAEEHPAQQAGVAGMEGADVQVAMDRIGRIEEIQRLECEHAEASREHIYRMLHIIAVDSREPFPDPPVRPQRLIDLLAGASSSGPQDAQPPS